MITKPPIDELTVKAGDKYTLCCVVSKRAKELNNDLDMPVGAKPISVAAEEFDKGVLEINRQVK